MNEFLSQLEIWLNAHQQWLAAAIFITAFIESLAIAGVIVPGVAILFLLAVLTGHGSTTLATALSMAFLGAIAGDGLSFYLGRYFKNDIHKLWPFTRYPTMLSSGEAFFHKHGGKSIIIGRFIGPIRPIIPLVTGALNYPPRRFFLFNVISAFGWAPAYILPGYIVGASLQANVSFPPRFYPILITTLITLSVCFLVGVRLQWALQSKSRFYDYVANRVRNYSQTHLFWKMLSRQRPEYRGEFPLASMTLAVLSASGFVLLSLVVSETTWLAEFNQTTLLFFEQLRNPLFDPPFIIFTILGNSAYLYIVFIAAVAVMIARGHYAAGIHIACAGIATVLLSHGFKDLFAITRPETISQPLDSYAFPSGHTSGTTVFLMLMAAFIAQEQAPKRRWKTYLCFLIPTILMGLTRLYLGVHWFTDIVGGLLLGFFICAVTRVIYSRFDKEAITTDMLTWGALLLCLLAAIGYVGLHYNQWQAIYKPLALQ